MNPTNSMVHADSVPRRRLGPDVEWVDVDGEVVAWVQETESLHILDPIASLVFQLCDGTAAVSSTTEDLATAFGRDPESIVSDVLTCVASLQEQRLVEVDR